MTAKRMMAAGLAAALLLSPPALPAAAAGERPTTLVYTSTKLENGLWVVLHEDHSTPIVHVSVTYHVGSKNERPGRTGFAHLFEHLMFQGSKNVAQDAHQSYIASIGGESNASTNEDSTNYWETVPSHFLPLALWLEADRMASLQVDEANLKSERDVVKEEFRQSVLLTRTRSPFDEMAPPCVPAPSMNVRFTKVAAAPKSMPAIAPALLPLRVRLFAVGPVTVRCLVMNSGLASVMMSGPAPGIANVIVSVAQASAMACRRLPGPLSSVLVTTGAFGHVSTVCRAVLVLPADQVSPP